MRLRCYATILAIFLTLPALAYAQASMPTLPDSFSAKTSTVVLPSPSATTGNPAVTGGLYEDYTNRREHIDQAFPGGSTEVLKLYTKHVQYTIDSMPNSQGRCSSQDLTSSMTPFFEWVQYSQKAGTGTYKGQPYTAWEYYPPSGPIKSMIVWVASDNQTPLVLFLETAVTIKITFDSFTAGTPASSYFAVPSVC